MKFFRSNKEPDSNPYTIGRVSRYELESVTNTLIKFCKEHGIAAHSTEIKDIETIHALLKKDNVEEAKSLYENMTIFCKEGFYEWYPRAKQENETQEYLIVIFQSLLLRWSDVVKRAFT